MRSGRRQVPPDSRTGIRAHAYRTQSFPPGPRFAASASNYQFSFLFAFICGLVDLPSRQPHLETRVARPGFETNVATVFAHDSGDGVEAEASSFTDLLGGEERFEHARANGRRYASSVVTNLNHD